MIKTDVLTVILKSNTGGSVSVFPFTTSFYNKQAQFSVRVVIIPNYLANNSWNEILLLLTTKPKAT